MNGHAIDKDVVAIRIVRNGAFNMYLAGIALAHDLVMGPVNIAVL